MAEFVDKNVVQRHVLVSALRTRRRALNRLSPSDKTRLAASSKLIIMICKLSAPGRLLCLWSKDSIAIRGFSRTDFIYSSER
jgi:hypothetical protein